MPILIKLRSQVGRSFADTLMWLFEFVENRPAYIRPALYGAFFVWALILFRAGVIPLPIALIAIFFTNRDLFWPFVLTFLVLAPAGGFIGGILYSAISPVANRLGIVGRVLKFTVAASAYLTVLVFVIMPLLQTENKGSLSDQGDWIFIGGFGLLLGIIMAWNTRRDAA
jgi:hypothetical protein